MGSSGSKTVRLDRTLGPSDRGRGIGGVEDGETTSCFHGLSSSEFW